MEIIFRFARKKFYHRINQIFFSRVINVRINSLLHKVSSNGFSEKNESIKEYLGPKPDTCEDLWRMMWELKLKSIVMLTNVIEGASRMVNFT